MPHSLLLGHLLTQPQLLHRPLHRALDFAVSETVQHSYEDSLKGHTGQRSGQGEVKGQREAYLRVLQYCRDQHVHLEC